MTVHRVFIPHWRPAKLNDIMRMHHMRAHKIKRADKALIAAYCTGLPKATGMRSVTLHFTLTSRQKEGDCDSTWKNLLDGLTQCGMLLDDNRHGVRLGTITYERGTKDHWGTTIILEDVHG